LDHESTSSLFDDPDYHTDEAASIDVTTGDHHNTSNEKSPQQLQHEKYSADWNTRASIALVEVIAVTLIVGTVLLCCLRKHRRRMERNHRRLMATMPAPAVVAASAGTSSDNQHIEVNRTPLDRLRSVPRTIGNIVLYPLRLLEEGINGWATENYDEVFLRQFMERLEAERDAARENPDDREIRLKDAFVKKCMVWELGDEHFFLPEQNNDEHVDPSSPMFVFEGMDQDDTVNCIKDDNKHEANQDDEELVTGSYGVGEDEQDLEDGTINDDIHAQNSGEVNDNALDVEEGKIEEVQGCDYFEGEENKEAIGGHPEGTSEEEYDNTPEVVNGDIAMPVPNRNNSTGTDNDVDNATTGDCHDTEDLSAPVTMPTLSADENALASNHASTSMEQQGLQMMAVTASAATTQEQLSLMSSELVGGTSAGTLHSTVPPPVITNDTFDTETTQGYLYLNTFGHNRRGANTDGSHGTIASSANQSLLSSVESMESMVSTAVSSTSEDSHKIPNQCAICICDYERGDTIVTSCNGDCPHAFHQECIVEWLIKMQDGTPCPCCRRTFVELEDHIPCTVSSGNNTTTTTNSTNANDTAQDPEEAERLRQERRRRDIELGIRRGRAFNTSAISLRNNVNDTPPEEADRLRQERLRRNLELGIRRGRAFNTSVISLR